MPLLRTLADITAISMAALAADSVPRVMQEGDANDLYPIAHLADGLKFTHGAFICADLSAGRFFTLSRNGDLVATAKLEFPDDEEYHISDFDLFSDGSIVAAALPSPYTDVSPFLAFLSPDGKTKHIVRTGVYFPYHLVVAGYGTVWTLGHETIQGNAKDPSLDPNAGILRQFSRSGSAMASALPQSNFRASREEARISWGKLFAVGDRLGWYSAVGRGKPVCGNTDRHDCAARFSRTAQTGIGPVLGRPYRRSRRDSRWRCDGVGGRYRSQEPTGISVRPYHFAMDSA
jgi:hypothetical protein